MFAMARGAGHEGRRGSLSTISADGDLSGGLASAEDGRLGFLWGVGSEGRESMKNTRTKSFAAGVDQEFEIAEFVAGVVEELGRDKKLRVSIETVAAGFIVDEVIEELGLGSAAAKVYAFKDYRSEIKKPIRSVSALSRLLKKFRDRPDWLEEAVNDSVANGWTGLFIPKAGNGREKADRSFQTEGGSIGGEW